MKKLLLTLLLIACVAVSASAAGTWTHVFSTSPGISNSGDSKTLTLSGVNWNFSATYASTGYAGGSYGSDGYVQVGKKGSNCKTLTLSTTGFDGVVTNVSVKTRAGNGSGTQTLSVSVGGTTYQSQTITHTSGSTLGTYTFTGNSQGEIVIEWSGSATFYVGTLTVTTVDARPAPALAWGVKDGESFTACPEFTADLNAPATLPTVAVSDNLTYDLSGALTVTSSNPAVADWANGQIVLKDTGTTTLTANFGGDATYGKGSAALALTVVGKPTCQPLTVTPLPETGKVVYVDSKMVVTCETADALLSYSIMDAENKEIAGDLEVAMPFEYTFTAPGTYKFSGFASKAGYNDGPGTDLTYVVDAITPSAPTFSVTAENVAYNTALTITSANANQLQYTITYNDAENTVTVEGNTATINITKNCTISAKGLGRFGKESASVIRLYEINLPAAPTATSDTYHKSLGTEITITAAAGCTVRYSANGAAAVDVAANEYTFPLNEDTKIEAWSVLPNGYSSKASVTKNYIVIRPEAPTGSTGNSYTKPYGTEITITAPLAGTVQPTLRYSVNDGAFVDEPSGTYSFNLVADTKIVAWSVLSNGYASETPLERNYTVKRPEAPVFNVAAGNVEQGTMLTITAPEGSTIIYQLDQDAEQKAEQTKQIQLISNVTVKAWSVLPNDYRSEAATERAYTIVTPAPAEAVAPSAPTGATVVVGAKVRFSVPNADYINVTNYRIDGSAMDVVRVDGNVAQVTVDKMNRRFDVQGVRNVYGDNNGHGPVMEAMYGLGAGYKLVTDAAKLTAGMKFVLSTADGKVMNTSNTGIRPYATDCVIISNAIADVKDALICELEESSTAGKWYLKVAEGVKDASGNAITGYMSASSATTTPFSVSSTPSNATISINAVGVATISYYPGRCIFYNKATTANCFGSYQTSYAEGEKASGVKIGIYAYEPAPANPYSVSFKHNAYVKSGQKRAAAAESTHETDAVVDENGVITFSSNDVANLCGEVNIEINGTKLMGLASEAKTEFSADDHDAYNTYVRNFNEAFADNDKIAKPTECAGDHRAYVYAANNTAVTLVAADHPQATPISTNPDTYHEKLELHTNPTLTVQLDPFRSAKLTVSSAGGPVTGVSNIAVDTDTRARYYNLQGVEVSGTTPGVYLRRQGNITTKVVVK